MTFGGQYPANFHDVNHLPKLHIIWGSNIIQTRGPQGREWIRASLLKGSKLVVIDPKRIDIAKRADLWIRPRPGMDAALAMGVLKVTIDEKLYDEDFVSRLTVGFDKIKEEVGKFTLDDVERVTWVPKEQIVKLARMYKEYSPAVIHEGNAVTHGIHSFYFGRAVDILRGISGPPNTPASDAAFTPPPYMRMGKFFLLKQFPRKPEKTAGNEHKFAMMTAYIPHHALLRGVLEEKPYPIKAGIFIITNPISSYPDGSRTYEAFKKMELVVVAELFMTPTTAMADILLPAATSGEFDTFGYWSDDGSIRAFPKLVDPPGEAWPDAKWLNELAKRVGLQDQFWPDYQDAVKEILEPSGLDWEGFREKTGLPPVKHERELEEGSFSTPSGKIEIYSEQSEKIGCDPMPRWEVVSRMPLEPTEEYPLLLTNRIEDAYKLTGFKRVQYLRSYKPYPEVELNPDTAEKLGLKEGDMAYIETKKGRIMQKAALDPDLDERVVFVAYGWWFPEDPENQYQWDKANLNLLLDNYPAEPATGTVETRGVPCRIYKA
jgi:anaerobic selenocysteine-containing dehydrogenase